MGRGVKGEAREVGRVYITKGHISNCKKSGLKLEDNVNLLNDYNQENDVIRSAVVEECQQGGSMRLVRRMLS